MEIVNQMDNFILGTELSYNDIAKKLRVTRSYVKARASELKYYGEEFPERKTLTPKFVPEVDDLILNSRIPYSYISCCLGLPQSRVRTRALQLTFFSYDVPKREVLDSAKLKKKDLKILIRDSSVSFDVLSCLYGVGIEEVNDISRKQPFIENDLEFLDQLIAYTGFSYLDISRYLQVNYKRVCLRAIDLINTKDLTFTLRNNQVMKNNLEIKNSERDLEILECALTMFDSVSEIGRSFGISRQWTSQILERNGFMNYNQLRKNYLCDLKLKSELKEEKINLLNLLRNQEKFLELTEQRGENYALAWRVRDVNGLGKDYSLEQLEKLIELRREGNGFYRCVRLSGLAHENKEIKRKVSSIYRVLKKALFDVDYPGKNKQFVNSKM